jgi:D-glycero-beta-D-manno-heptose-7-phosphate kinase
MTPELFKSAPRLKRLLPRFRKLRIGVIGDLMLDRYVLGGASRLSPEAPVPVVEYQSQEDVPGGAANVAMNIAALGARVQAFGVIGVVSDARSRAIKSSKTSPDEAGASLIGLLQKRKILDGGILTDVGRATTLKTRVIARHQQIVRIDRERREPLSAGTEEKLFRLTVAALKNLDALILSDYDKGVLEEGLADRVLNAAHKMEVPVFVKPKTSQVRSYPDVRVVVCNAKEAGHYFGRTLADEKSIEEAGTALVDRFGCRTVVITRGQHGMSVCQGEEAIPRHLHIPATSSEVTYARIGKHGVEPGAAGRQVFDVTGAGDTVLSVMALAVAAGASVPEAALLANAAAGVVVGKLGTATLSPAELASALHEIHN